MYTIQHTIFGDYRDVAWENNIVKALRKAKEFNNSGWLNIRIITPEDTIIQVCGI